MHIRSIIVTLSVLLPGCGPKIVGHLGITDSDASDTSPGPGDDGTSGVGATSDPSSSTSAGATTTSMGTTTDASATLTDASATTTDASATTTSAGTSTTGSEDSDGPPPIPAACLAVDHETCYDAVIAACLSDGHGTWFETPACVAAVQDCYPIGTQALATADVIEFCSAEFSAACLKQNLPGCSETFCTCTAGGYPFDWNNCWDLTLIACWPWGEVTSDCEAVLAGCYPGATLGEYEQCRQQVYENVGPEGECYCPMCGFHEQCEDALDACLGA